MNYYDFLFAISLDIDDWIVLFFMLTYVLTYNGH